MSFTLKDFNSSVMNQGTAFNYKVVDKTLSQVFHLERDWLVIRRVSVM